MKKHEDDPGTPDAHAFQQEQAARQDVEHRLQKTLQELATTQEMLKQSQSLLIQNETMASLGRLAAGMTHEISNPLAYVMSNLETLCEYVSVLKKVADKLAAATIAQREHDQIGIQRALNEATEIGDQEDLAYVLEDVDKLMAQSLHGAEQIKKIVQTLKSYAKLDEADVMEVDINECIEETIKIAWNEIKYKCSVQKTLRPLPRISCYSGSLKLAFLKLLLNAAQSIPNRGSITIETNAGQENILICIADTGRGFSAEQLQNIFTPFISTHASEGNEGFNLSIVSSIIQKNNGSITAQSELGQGAIFTIKLPASGARQI